MSKLKFTLDALDGVPEHLAAFYAEGEDGKYRLMVEGGVEKQRVDEFRASNITLTKANTDLEAKYALLAEQLAAYKVFGDPASLEAELGELRGLSQKVADKDLIDKRGFEEAVNRRTAEMKATADGQIKALTERSVAAEKRAELAEQRHQRAVVDRAVTDAALKAGAAPSAIPDVLFRARENGWTLNEKGQVVKFDESGDIAYGADGASPITPLEWTNGYLKDSAPHIFQSVTGVHAMGSGAGGGAKNPWAPDSRNLTEQMRIYKEKPALARQMAAQHGITLRD